MLGKPSTIDELTRGDHVFLEAADQCIYFGEYTAGQLAQHSQTNQLVRNFKHEVRWRQNPSSGPWMHKQRAIRSVAEAVARAIKPEFFSSVTLVPTPPSKAKTDPAYDSRAEDCLRLVSGFAGCAVDVRELVRQRTSTAASHKSEVRASVDELTANYEIDEALVVPRPQAIIVFDDLLTTGRHFKAMQRILHQRFPGVLVYGLFVARRKIECPFPDLT